MKQQKKYRSIEDILGLIELMIYQGGSNFTIIHLGPEYYMQILCEKGAYEMYCEAVSNYYLDQDSKLNDKQLKKLEELNWKLSDEENNYSISLRVDSDESRKNLALFLLQTAKEVYHFEDIGKEGFNIHLDH